MNAAPIADNAPPANERFRRAALAAAMAVRTAGPSADVTTVVANAGIAQTVSPIATATIAISIADLVRRGEVESLTSEQTINTIATNAENAELPLDPAIGPAMPQPLAPAAGSAAPGMSAPVSAPAAAAPFNPASLYELLSRSQSWEPTVMLFDAAGNGDRAGFDAALQQLLTDRFIEMQNGYVYVTESGRRFLEYSRYSLK